MIVSLSLSVLPALAPVPLLLGAAGAVFAPGRRPRFVLATAQAASLAALVLALSAVAVLIHDGPTTVQLLAYRGAGLGCRLDVVSATMSVLVAFIGWIVVRYSLAYLDGEARQGAFTGWLCLTLAAVMLMVLAGNLVQLVLGWIATSLFLHRLLLFYPERPGARRAARKKFISARIGDVAIVAAALLMAWTYGTADIAGIAHAARAAPGGASAAAIAALLALAALLKSAQFPLHGWLTEMMETPTPVSALLHAGVVNAGGFLLIRFADILLQAPGVLAVLAIVGGFTALFGGLVMLTQPAVKTSLAWSTVGQMGFMILECGLALFPLALLHIVAHSLYKAHSFLASGGAVEQVAAIRRPGPVAVPGAAAVGRAFLAALAIYAAFGLGFGAAHEPPQAAALGAILILGTAYMFAQGFADAAPRQLAARTAIYALATAAGYFVLQRLMVWLTRAELPPPPPPGPLDWLILVVALTSFAAVAVAQALLPHWAHHPAAAALRVHLSNGFYANAMLDRWLGGWGTRAGTRRGQP